MIQKATHSSILSSIHPYILLNATFTHSHTQRHARTTAIYIYSHHGDDQAASDQPVLADHQLLGTVRGEGGRLPAEVDAQSPAEEVPQLVPVPLSELPGGAHPAAPAQR